MIRSIPGEAVVEMLLNSLAAERYLRGPLLLTLIDELGARDELRPAADVARRVLASVQDRSLDEGDFVVRLEEIRVLVNRRMRAPAA